MPADKKRSNIFVSQAVSLKLERERADRDAHNEGIIKLMFQTHQRCLGSLHVNYVVLHVCVMLGEDFPEETRGGGASLVLCWATQMRHPLWMGGWVGVGCVEVVGGGVGVSGVLSSEVGTPSCWLPGGRTWFIYP